ncbi:hypothetical protein TRFO_36627 [Tritrichomonas foetus]|uniref:Uncharacterized protein n=1 Tax=Tritrichomonas foetus TaxID=1144522 RepID=A0A1J4JI58_9EUKA|nr:hypothetical protein TRFO_36627 [Tritrichomonas foetus]|eukprot:OHS97205.1 hypothetical protein TRFO_36627 [Tritrichomonas foetus]
MFEASDSCNLHYIKHIDEIEFKDELKKSPYTLQLDHASTYFKIVLSHFRHQIPKETKHIILTTLYKILSTDEFLDVFVTEGFAPILPFSHKDVLDDLFDILFLLVTKAPQVFDEFVSNSLSKLVRYRGLRSIIILAIYSEKFSTFKNPWPVVDILFKEKDRFLKADICIQYCALLANLVMNEKEFMEKRGSNAFEVITSLLNSDQNSIVVSAYSYLCIIINKIPYCEVPFEILKEQLKNHHFTNSVLELLLISPIEDENSMYDKTLIKNLLRIAGSGSKLALMVLLKLAKREDIASLLVEDPVWMEKELPSLVDTLRLFLVVFGHKNLRSKITTDPEFPLFLNSLIDTGEIERMSLCLLILRRVDPLSEELIQDLNDSEFVTKFIEYEERNGSDEAIYDAILLIDTIGKRFFTRDILKACKNLNGYLRTHFEQAAAAAINLCAHEKYAKKFRDLGMVDFFKKKKKDQSKRKRSMLFLRAIGETPDELAFS